MTVRREDEAAPLRIALAGNPNSGKTTLFNALTGAHQHVGNYPGVTVEKREGHYAADGERIEVLDLPGTYSLTSYSPEERIAQDELLLRTPDVVVVVVDSTTLKRSLVLLAQLMQLGAKLVLCLNMTDEAEAAGQRLDLALLERLLGFPVVQTVGHRSRGLEALRAAIARVARQPAPGPSRLVLGDLLDRALATVRGALAATPLPPAHHPWVATKLLLGDPAFAAQVHGEPGGREAVAVAEAQRKKIEAQTRRDTALYLMEQYYGFVDGLLRQVLLQPAREDARAVSDRIDAILAHRLLGLPFFLAVMYGIFWLTFTVGEIPMGWIGAGVDALRSVVSASWPGSSDSPLRSLVVDGILGGVGGVIVFLPNIVLLFMGLAFIEDTGYMGRAAFLMDRLMHRFGLHGRSFVPMMTGFGCTVPAILATRTLEHEHDRLATMLVLPLISCGARLTIWMLLIPAFFAPEWRAPVLWTIYVVGIAFALLLALLLRNTLLRGEEAPFVMELPPYRLPTLRAVLTKMTERSWVYLRKAGTIILGISMLMWLITTYPRAEAPAAAAVRGPAASASGAGAAPRRTARDLRHSIAGRVGRALEPALEPLGFDWKIGTAMIGAFAAKEVFVAQLAIIYAVGEPESEQGAQSLQRALRRDYSPLSGFSLMLFLLIATPCMATFAVTRRESGSWKWPLLQLGGMTGLAYLVALVFYQVARLIAG